MKAHIDFETRSGSNLKLEGAEKYSRDRSTGILCLAVAFDDEPVTVFGFELEAKAPVDSPYIFSHYLNKSFQRLLDHVSSGGICVAHNSPFELAIWNNVGQIKYGLPPLLPEQTDCTMARAYAMALPGSLDGARAAVGITTEKDAKGHRLMLKMSQPRTRTVCPLCSAFTPVLLCPTCDDSGEVFTWWNDPEDCTNLFSYCGKDAVVERLVDKRLAPLSRREKHVWLLDYKINNAGVRVDLEAAKVAALVIDQEEDRLDESMRVVTMNQVVTCKAHKQLTKWITDQGVETPGVAKNDVTSLLGSPSLPSSIRDALNIRQEAAKTSTAKLAAMLNRACTHDNRLRGMFQYWGANTGRWAARGVQLQNLPRPTISQKQIDSVFGFLASDESIDDKCWMIDSFIGPPMAAVSNCLRGFLVPSAEKDFIAVDFSAIEARFTAWLAGEEAVLEVFRGHGKIYEYQAALIYLVSYLEILKSDPRRQIGKAATLGFGFGGGVGAIQKICKSVGIIMEPAFDGLWKIADVKTRDRALSRYKSEVTKAIKKHEKECKKAIEEGEKIPRPLDEGLETGINQREWLASELTKIAWRASNPNIVKYWALLEEAAVSAVQNVGKVFSMPKGLPPVSFCVKGSFLQCTLPSGRKLTYPYPKVSEEETPWGSKKFTLTYMSEDAETHRWVRTPTYGGSLCENVVQAGARDLLIEAMIVLDGRNETIVMHVHDEIVLEVPEMGFGFDYKIPLIEKLVSEVPAWASGLPMAAEGWRGKRYRK